MWDSLESVWYGNVKEHYCTAAGVYNADKVIVHEGRGIYDDTPDFDRAVNMETFSVSEHEYHGREILHNYYIS